MKIGIIGSGEVAQALAHGFIEIGHEVMIGSRNPQSKQLQDWLLKHTRRVAPGSFEQAAKFGEMIILACRFEGGAIDNAIKLSGKENFINKTVIDVTNPLDFSKGSPPSLLDFKGDCRSGGEYIQNLLPKSKIVKTFNIISSSYMYKPYFDEGYPDMFVCGNDSSAKDKVKNVLKDFGWSYIDIGSIKSARYMEALAMIWILYGLKTNTWHHAFHLLKG